MSIEIDLRLEYTQALLAVLEMRSYSESARRRPMTNLDVLNMAQQNFYLMVPGGRHWNRYEGFNDSMTIGEFIDAKYEEPSRVRKNQSHTLLSSTIKQHRERVFAAFIHAGMPIELFEELERSTGPNGARDIIKRESPDIFRILYDAHNHLRRQGYSHGDLSSF